VGGEPFFSTTRAMTTEGHPGELATVFSPLILGWFLLQGVWPSLLNWPFIIRLPKVSFRSFCSRIYRKVLCVAVPNDTIYVWDSK
jgi:glucan phosphoethanolaminetransferase (alkaline phosphatase superfamily)